MKKIQEMRKNLCYGLLSVCGLFSLLSCSDDDNVSPLVALKQARLTPAEQAISVAIVPKNAYSLEADNASDSIAYDVPHEALQQATLELTTTVGVGIEAYYNGELVQGPIVVDATQPVPVEVRGYGQSKHYTLRVYQEQVNKAGEEPRLKSSDMRKAGLNPNAYDYDMILFKDKFYAITSSLTDQTLAEYQLYTSDNGIMWDEVPYTCKDKDGKDVTVGGRGARLAVADGRMFVLGGGRYDGTDKYGYGPEVSWGSPTVANWRSCSTEDGVNFRVDTIGIQYAQSGETLKRRAPYPMAYPVVASYQDALYCTGGFSSQSFGMWQSSNQFTRSLDGVNWDAVTPSNGVVLANLKHCTYFTFKGKLWVLGGFANFCTESNMRSNIYSTTNGVDWTLETDSPAFGKLSGMAVAATDDVLYLFGGEYFAEDGKRTISNKIYRSEDGKNWEEMTTISEKYVSRRSPRVVVKDGVAYIFGGYQGPTTDNYGYPNDKDTMFDTYTMTLQ